MVRLALHSIAYEAKTLNLAKAGYTAFYVDDAIGSDAHDGGSWGQAFKTIQYALDESKPWTKIYVRDGTYSEFLTFATDSITLVGESRTGTLVSAPSNSDNAITITADDVHISNIKVVAISPTSSIMTNADYTKLTSINFTRWLYLQGDFTTVDDVYSATHGIAISGNRNIVTKCLIENALEGVYINDSFGVSSKFNKIIDNEFRNGTYGVFIAKLVVESEHNTITHNNIIGCTTSIKDEGSNNHWFENYYSSHTTDTNNDGLCDTAYTEGGATDYQPVSHRNGWKQESLGNTLSRNVSMMEFWSDMDVSVSLTTSTANLPLPDVVIADIPSSTTIIRVIGMIDIREIVNTSGSGANALTAAAVINVKKSTGSWGTDDVALINFPDNSWNVSASTRRAARMFVGDNDASSEVDENATYNLRFDGNVFVDYSTLGLVDVAVGLRVYFIA